MIWNKDVSVKSAAEYRESFVKSIVGKYTDTSELYPVITSMKLDENIFLLDAGCGTGRFMQNTKLGQPFVGLDISLEMIKLAKKELKRGLFVVGKLEQLPFKNDVFDEIISVRVLQHIKNKEQVIRNFSRVSKKNGKIIILCLNSWTVHCL